MKFKLGDTVWHEFRYWKSDSLEAGEVLGWNTEYLAYEIVKITSKRIVVDNSASASRLWVGSSVLWLNRATMEREGKQYHTRFHEYFYAEKPAPNSADWNWMGSNPYLTSGAFTVLGLPVPFSEKDVRRAYKRLALKTHPDLGGNSQDFIKLKEAHDSALRFATRGV